MSSDDPPRRPKRAGPRPAGQSAGPRRSADRRLSRVLGRVPLFPLPDVVLFPHALMPLHIFEPRYRQMTRDILASHKLVILGRRLEDEEPGEPPPAVAPVAGLGEVALVNELPDGRFNLVLRGRARVRIDDELPADEPYRLVSATELPDDAVDDQGELADADASLRALVTGLADVIQEGGELLKQVIAGQPTPAALVDVVAAALITDVDVRQRLLETTSISARIERVSAEVVAMTGRISPSHGVN